MDHLSVRQSVVYCLSDSLLCIFCLIVYRDINVHVNCNGVNATFGILNSLTWRCPLLSNVVSSL